MPENDTTQKNGPWCNKRPTHEELQKIVRDHEKWIESGKQGPPPADLTGINLGTTSIPIGKTENIVLTKDGAEVRKKQLAGKADIPIDLRGVDLGGINFTEATLDNVLFEDANLRGVNFSQSTLVGAKMARADLTGSIFKGASLYGADLTGADLNETKLKGVILKHAMLVNVKYSVKTLQGAMLDSANLSYTDMNFLCFDEASLNGAKMNDASFVAASFIKSNLENANGANSDFTHAIFEKSNCKGLKLNNAKLEGALFSKTSFEGGDIQRANAVKTVFRDSILTKLKAVGAQLDESIWLRIKMVAADLRDVSMRNAELTLVDLTGSRLSNADLSESDLSNVQASNVEFHNTNLYDTNLRYADLTEAQFNGTNLTNSILSGAIVVKSSFVDAKMDGTRLFGVDLSKASQPGEENTSPIVMLEKCTSYARKIFTPIMLACSYVLLTVSGSGFQNAIKGNKPIVMPIIKFSIAPDLFLIFAPLLLLGLYIYLHLYLFRSFELISLLPSVSGKGGHVFQKIDPWLALSMAKIIGPWNIHKPKASDWFQFVIIFSLMWLLVPLTLGLLASKFFINPTTWQHIVQVTVFYCSYTFGFLYFVKALYQLKGRAKLPSYLWVSAIIVSAAIIFWLLRGDIY